MQKKYELLIIYSTKEKKDVNLMKNSSREKIEAHNFTILSEQEMGNRNLAYPINKQKEGFYQIFYISPKNEKPEVNELLKDFRRDPDILRPLIFVYDEGRIERVKQKEEEFKRRKIELENKKRMQAEQANSQNITEETFQNPEMKEEGKDE
ncbi:MAG: 30S ribosomal protein S6 [Spirochaetota bacterium]|nr:30S ribosomal protein S6 [Exilispira sp.]